MVCSRLFGLMTALEHFIEELLGLPGPGLPVELILESCAQLLIGLLSRWRTGPWAHA